MGFIGANLPMDPDWVVRFYNQRGTAEQHMKKGKYSISLQQGHCSISVGHEKFQFLIAQHDWLDEIVEQLSDAVSDLHQTR